MCKVPCLLNSYSTYDQRPIKDILRAYSLATYYDSTWYKAWHMWALANFDVVGYLESQTEGRSELPGEELAMHIVEAVNGTSLLALSWDNAPELSLGFFKSISLRNVNTLQDTLRLLTLWFKYGAHDDVSHAMATGFSDVEIDTWLEVIPQIIARIQTPSANIRRNITRLLTDVGKHHPQALIYPLTVAAKSSSAPRRSVAQGMMDRMRDHSPIIVNQVCQP